MSENNMIPPKPDCKCFGCGHSWFLKDNEEKPQKCPKCNSEKIMCTRQKIMYDPPIKKGQLPDD